MFISIWKLGNRRWGAWLLFILFVLGLAGLGLADAAGSRISDGRYVATEWARRYEGPLAGYMPAAIAVDGQGNIYIIGSSWSGTSADFLTIKYGPDGRTLWTRNYNSPEDYYDYATAMAVDAQGNVYVTGYSVKTWDKQSPASTIFVTLKYDTDGELLWERHYDGPIEGGRDIPVAMALDPQGNVLVTGESGKVDVEFASATVKYSPDGLELWVRRFQKGYDSSASAIAADAQGNVYITGGLSGSGFHGDFFTVKYSPVGEELWWRRYKGGNAGGANALALDGQGNVYVSGSSMEAETGFDYVTIKYSPEGKRLWVRRYNGPGNQEDIAHAIALDAQGNVLVTGHSTGSGTNHDYATIKYSPDGKRLWVRRYKGTGNDSDSAHALALDGQGNVYVTGSSRESGIKFMSTTIKYSPEGRRLWLRRYQPSATEAYSPTAMALDGRGNVYLTGVASPPGTFVYDFLTIKYTQTP